MTLLRPNLSVSLRRRGAPDIYAQPTYGTARTVRVGVVRLSSGGLKTSVRADSSASRGRADEPIAAAVLLFMPADEVVPGDLVLAAGIRLEVVMVELRYNLQGALDHREATLEISGTVG